MDVNGFIAYLFNRPPCRDEWYFHDDHKDLGLDGGRVIALSADIFEGISDVYNEYSESQICMGLRYLINPSCSSIPYLYMDKSIDIFSRVRAISSMRAVFEDLFAKALAGKGLFQSEGVPGINYATTCYMWWDVFPRHGVPARDDLMQIDDEIVKTIISILKIDNLACQESSLHGLGHWMSARPEEAFGAVEGFIRNASSEIKWYALDVIQRRSQ